MRFKATRTLAILSLLSLLPFVGCTPRQPQGEALMVAGRWDEAVAYYLEAVRRFSPGSCPG